MLDNLRDQPEVSIFNEEEAPPEEIEEKPGRIRRPHRTFDQMTGTTAFQRFVLSVMIFITVCLLGFMFLVLTGKLNPSFLF